jgi:hypothetical protein
VLDQPESGSRLAVGYLTAVRAELPPVAAPAGAGVAESARQ